MGNKQEELMLFSMMCYSDRARQIEEDMKTLGLKPESSDEITEEVGICEHSDISECSMSFGDGPWIFI